MPTKSMKTKFSKDYLFGRKKVDSLLINKESAAEGSIMAKKIAQNTSNFNARDLPAKIREDPLFSIKKRGLELANQSKSRL